MTPTSLLPASTWLARLAAAGILLQTLFFKFTGAPESVRLFETLGMEPWGRIGIGVLELVAAAWLLLPPARFAATGALMAVGLMSGAIFFHLTELGLVVDGDGGALFAMAVVVFLSSGWVLFRERKGLGEWLRFLPGRSRAAERATV